MNGLTRLLGIGLVCAATAAFSAENPNFKVKTTRDLVNLCSEPTGSTFYDAAMGYCIGFIDAAHDYHQAVTAGDLLKPIACPGAKVTRQDMVDMFLAWSKSHGDLLDSESPIHGLMRAASDKWPC